ncbi:MAG: hypothetical protein C0501_26440 [Isosphaera sp.]|nr:hypothetical protein [Isosphaera sp.]
MPAKRLTLADRIERLRARKKRLTQMVDELRGRWKRYNADKARAADDVNEFRAWAGSEGYRPDEVWDAVQDTAVAVGELIEKALIRAVHLRPIVLFEIAVENLRKNRRADREFRRVPAGYVRHLERRGRLAAAPPAEEQHDPAPDPHALLTDALAGLPASDRELLAQRYRDGRTRKEIAARYELTPGQVAHRLRLARTRLRRLVLRALVGGPGRPAAGAAR